MLCTAVCSGVRAADQKCLLKHVWVVPESREICAKSETDETAKTEKIPGSEAVKPPFAGDAHFSPPSCPNVAAGRQSGDGPLFPERQMPRRRLPSSQPASADRRLEGLVIIIGEQCHGG